MHCFLSCLNDADFICNIKSVIVRCEANICFLHTIWTNQRVDPLCLDVIKSVNSRLNLEFIGAKKDIRRAQWQVNS